MTKKPRILPSELDSMFLKKATHQGPREITKVPGKRKFQKKYHTDLQSSKSMFMLNFLFGVLG